MKLSFFLKALIIGTNDVGKATLVYPLRFLFDNSISE